MKPISIAALNLKGGSGKSTSIINLGGICHASKRKPILIDTDPQQSATQWARQGNDKFPYPVLPMKVGKDVSQFRKTIEMAMKEHKADMILFDTPPQLQDEALIAALLSDIVLIPVTPSPLDLWAAQKAIDAVREARRERKGQLPKIILVPSRLIPNSLLAREIKESLKSLGEAVSPPIFMRVAMAEACVVGLPINIYSPNSPSHREFVDLWKFINSDIGKVGNRK